MKDMTDHIADLRAYLPRFYIDRKLIDALEKLIDAIERELRARRATIDDQRTTLADCGKRNEELRTENTQLRTKLDELQTQNDWRNTEIEKLRAWRRNHEKGAQQNGLVRSFTLDEFSHLRVQPFTHQSLPSQFAELILEGRADPLADWIAKHVKLEE